MTSRSDESSPRAAESVGDLRASILRDALPPAGDTTDFDRVQLESLRAARRGSIVPRGTELRLRLTGAGIPGHEVSVGLITDVLSSMQGAVTAIGSAVKKAKRADTPRRNGKHMGVRKATELRLSAGVTPGSVVFHLQGHAEENGGEGQLIAVGSESLVDFAIVELFRVVEEAENDSPDAIGQLTTRIQALGARTASHLNALAEAADKAEVEVDLGHWSPSGARHGVVLHQRGARALRAAVHRNRTQVLPSTMTGRLHTVSDGADNCRLELDDGNEILLSVTPEVGLGMGGLLGKRVSARVETTVRWKIASGTERRTYKLLDVSSLEADGG